MCLSTLGPTWQKCVRRTASLNQKFLHRSPADAWAWASQLVPSRRSPSSPLFTVIFMNWQLRLKAASYWILSPALNDEVSMRHGKQEGGNSLLRSSLVSHAAAALTHDSERRAKWTFIPTVSSNQLARSLTQLLRPNPQPSNPPTTAARHLLLLLLFFFSFLPHILSVIIRHSGLMCSQPSLCWAICMTNRAARRLISGHFIAKLD